MGLIDVREAQRRLWDRVEATAHEEVGLDQAPGRVLAASVDADRDFPPTDRSAMDGFALRCADLNETLTLPIAGTVAAGDAPCALPRGQAMRIFTGAPLPEGADAVVMVEHATEQSDTVRFKAAPEPGRNIRRKGSDQRAGETLIRKGTRIAARHIGLLAANGIATVEVVRKPRVAVFSTGNELIQKAGAPLRPGQIPDANRPMLLALAAGAGADVSDLGILPDEAAATARALADMDGRFDLILTSGAVSMGGKDHVRDALIAAGGTIQGWRVALKPGKPVMFGRLGQCVVTGLPGNPMAALVGFHLFAGPQIAQLSGASPAPFADTPARAGFEWARKPGRTEIFPVRRLRHDSDGCAVLERLGRGVSATLLPVAEADGLAVVPAGTSHLSPGDRLTWHPFCRNGDLK